VPVILPSANGTSIRTEALRLHDRGLWVVPCRGKKAIWKDWQVKWRSREELSTALKDNPNLNVAIVLNQSEWIDMECDSDEAEARLQEWFGGSIPPTPTWKSKRGFHRLFRRPRGLPQKAPPKIDGVEVRGISRDRGALSIVPPSVHPDGIRYEWSQNLSLDEVEPAELPAAVAERLRASAPSQDTTPDAEGAILEGKRNDELFKVACKLVRAGLEPTLVETALRAENIARCKPPLASAELAEIVRSAVARAQAKPTNAQILLEIALADSELWQTPDDTAFATIRRNGHREHWPIRSKGYSQWLAKQFYDQEKNAVGSQTMHDVLSTIEGKAKFGDESPVYPAPIRVAEYEGRVYLDLADEDWRAIEIDPAGWRIVADPPVRFRRPARMQPLPEPQRGGSVAELRRFVNVTDQGWVLLLSWLVAAFRPDGPYPILKTIGEQGSAKTTLARVLRGLVDPNVCATRGAPRSERDLRIAAENGLMCAFDNLSYVTPELSDAICRLSSGGGFGVRTHYENSEETVFSAQRPILLNGIEDVGTRSDLLDRALVIELPRIEDKDRLSEKAFSRKFEAARPRIFGALLDAVAAALKNLPAVEQSKAVWPRMADFAQWVAAAEPALNLEAGTFLKAYERSRETANATALESSPVVAALLALLKARKDGKYEGTATELLDALSFGQDTRAKSWPKNARVLSGLLQRLAPNLRQAGVTVEQSRRGDDKVWRIETAATTSTQEPEKTEKRTHRTLSTQNPPPDLKPGPPLPRGLRKYLERESL
jgi:hypothetical protein